MFLWLYINIIARTKYHNDNKYLNAKNNFNDFITKFFIIAKVSQNAIRTLYKFIILVFNSKRNSLCRNVLVEEIMYIYL